MIVSSYTEACEAGLNENHVYKLSDHSEIHGKLLVRKNYYGCCYLFIHSEMGQWHYLVKYFADERNPDFMGFTSDEVLYELMLNIVETTNES